jgi:hypothetical protein
MKKIFIFLLFLASCVYPYDFTQDNIVKLMVVDGYVSNEPGNSEIRLSYSNEFKARVFDLVNNAKVEVIENSSVKYPYILKSPGLYVPVDTLFMADENSIYKLHIEVDGKIYESTEVNIIRSAPIDSLSFKATDKYRAGDKMQYRALDIAVTTFDDANASKYYRYSAEETWLVRANESTDKKYNPEFVYDSKNNLIDVLWNEELLDNITFCWGNSVTRGIVTAATEDLIRNQLVNVPVFTVSIENTKLLYRYSVLIKQFSIPKAAYHFLSLIRQFTDKSGTLFDMQPGFVEGNMQCITDGNEKAIGVFYATDIEESRLFIRFDELSPSDQLIVYLHDLPCAHETISIPLNVGASKTGPLTFIRDSLIYGKGLVVSDVLLGIGTDSTETAVLTNHFCADCRLNGTNIKPDFWGDILY